jgi:hypothetical protein
MLGDAVAPLTAPSPLSSPSPSPACARQQGSGWGSKEGSGRLRIGLSAQEWAEPGRLTLVVAPPRWLSGLESRLLLDTIATGRDAFLVSGDNRLDAYALLAQARAKGLETELADGVWITRAFTVHQLVALLEEALPLASRQHPLGLALATGLLEMFLDEDVQPHEARALFTRSVRRLDAWARTRDFPVIATLAQATGARAEALLAEVQGREPPRAAPSQLDLARSSRQATLEVA